MCVDVVVTYVQRNVLCDPVWWLPSSPRLTWGLWCESRPTGVWSGVSSGGSEGLGLSGLGSMDTFVSRPAVGASSPFMESVTLSNG